MPTFTVETMNPKAENLLQDLADMNLITCTKAAEPPKTGPVDSETLQKLKEKWKVVKGPSLEMLLNGPVASAEEMQAYCEMGCISIGPI